MPKGSVKRIISVALFVVGIMLGMGIWSSAMLPSSKWLGTAVVAGGFFFAGIMLWRSAGREIRAGRKERRDREQIYDLAWRRGGILYVSDVTDQLGIPPEAAREMLDRLIRDGLVKRENSSSGEEFYKFLEVIEQLREGKGVGR
ncbi:MAG: hypothetical protein ACUVXI_11695 [bacterium]